MAFKIGFSTDIGEIKQPKVTYADTQKTIVPRKSVVQVYFSDRHMTLAYYNDLFDLKCGDKVYVDGKLEGVLGRITNVNYNFKIKASDYKRVIALVDTDVKGQFFMAGSHFVTFERNALPNSKAISWFKAPENGDTEFIRGNDDAAFMLDNLKDMNVSAEIAERGHEYYMENRVKYLSIDGTKGYAIVQGSEIYEVEFEYCNGNISHLICSCFCSGNCKHEFAAMLQLCETLELIEKNYVDEYEGNGYFAAVNKGTLFSFALEGKETGGFVL